MGEQRGAGVRHLQELDLRPRATLRREAAATFTERAGRHRPARAADAQEGGHDRRARQDPGSSAPPRGTAGGVHALSALAFQLLEVVSFEGMLGSSEDNVRSKRRLPLIYTKDEDDGVEVYQVNYEMMADIGNFCAFQSIY